ncbi:flavodoxin family protein [Thermohalobacter berrensis]|uniref:NADPH-dependent FMN reductase n=1 Tax=Thermohalobacter berrensis TaxID=99594 RepID=A0A419T9X5_9FIRM|nr:flavodoxin family protein [Thermohalobacter berrensis]RKD34272.1 NADPH-dependent FMN reductase [Thermohalobacter berrensis]
MNKVLAIMGSPRKGKNTDILLNMVIKGIKKNGNNVEKIYLSDMELNPCTGCNYCAKRGECVINDDIQKLYDKFNDSDGIILASPLYFNTVSSIAKIMIDRCQVYWSNKFVLKNPYIDTTKDRIGMFICVGGAPYNRKHFDGCFPVIDLFFKAINTTYKYNILVSDTDKVPVWNRKDILAKAYSMGNKFFD